MRNQNAMDREAVFGNVPITSGAKQYNFMEAFLVVGSFMIATWCYTQGAYISSIVGFKQTLVSVTFASLFMLLIMEVPVIFCVRYGIDVWIWLKAVFGVRGVKILVTLSMILAVPWMAICSNLFATSMINLLSLAGIQAPGWCTPLFGLLCVAMGTLFAVRGATSISLMSRIMVPVMFIVAIMVIIIAFVRVPAQEILSFQAVEVLSEHPVTNYAFAVDANFAYILVQFVSMGAIPRLCKSERGGVWASVLGQGLAGSLFIMVGAVMAVSMHIVTGEMVTDPTIMIATLSTPWLALLSIVLVGFANISTTAICTYSYSINTKSSFGKIPYNTIMIVIASYNALLTIWGKVSDVFGVFLTVSGLLWAPLCALLFTDFFMIRGQKIDLRSALEVDGHKSYYYFHGFNPVGIIALVAGVVVSLLIYNPVTFEIHNETLFRFTPSICSLVTTGVTYFVLNQIPAVRKFIMSDRSSVTV